MGRPAMELSREALDAAASWRDRGCGYREIAMRLYRRHLVVAPIGPATVWRQLVGRGRAERKRRRAAGRGGRR